MNTNNKETELIKNIEQLQQVEKDLFSDLERSINNNASQDEKNKIIMEINRISNIRENLYRTLNSTVSRYHTNLENNSDILKEQTMAIEIIENQLNESKKKIAEIDQDNINKLRLIEINDYYGSRYNEHTKLMKIILAIFVPILIFTVLYNYGFLPSNIYFVLVVIVGFIGAFFIWYVFISIMSRDNMNYQEYNWFFNVKDAPSNDIITVDVEGVDPWQAVNITCIGQACCSDGTTYVTEQNKCILNTQLGDYSSSEGFENLSNDVFTKYASSGSNTGIKPDYVMGEREKPSDLDNMFGKYEYVSKKK